MTADLDLSHAPDSAPALLRSGLEEIGLDLADEQVERLLRYLAEIELWNPRLKLVAAAGRELVVRHLLDSLAGWAVLRRELGEPDGAPGPGGSAGRISAAAPPSPAGARLADLGTGAGLPGIPIAIAEPALGVDLVERSGRRVGFLRNAVAATRLSNVEVIQREAERYEGRPQIVVFRAFVPLSAELVATLRGIVATGGVICAYKGRLDSIREELVVAGLAEEEVRMLPVRVPYLRAERYLLVIQPDGP